jgi:hypothetical protein
MKKTMKKTLYDLEIEDVLTFEAGGKRMILGLHKMEGKTGNPLYHLSKNNNFDSYDYSQTAKELEEYNIKINYQEEDEEVEKAIKLLEKKGKLKDGKIINN